jgi:hypothetical protein
VDPVAALRGIKTATLLSVVLALHLRGTTVGCLCSLVGLVVVAAAVLERSAVTAEAAQKTLSMRDQAATVLLQRLLVLQLLVAVAVVDRWLEVFQLEELVELAEVVMVRLELVQRHLELPTRAVAVVVLRFCRLLQGRWMVVLVL